MAEINLNFDINKIKKLNDDRQDWLLNGKKNVDINSSISDVISELVPDTLTIDIREMVSLNEEVKLFTLSNLDGSSLPPFKAGQYIDVEITQKNNKYRSSFAILSSPKEAIAGVYKILVRKGTDEVNDYLFKLKKSEELIISRPYGSFVYSTVRDCENVIAIVNDFGILPVLSMAKAIYEGTEKFKLTIFYSAKNLKDVLFEDELNTLSRDNENINFNVVLFEQVDNYLNGYVTLDMIKDSIVDISSIFISGSEGLLKYLNEELMDLELPIKYYKYDSYFPKCNIRKQVEYKLSIYIKNEKYDVKCYNNKTIINSLAAAGLNIWDKDCVSYAKCELVKGKVKVINDIRCDVEKEYNFIHPAMTYPMSDIEIIVR